VRRRSVSLEKNNQCPKILTIFNDFYEV
jgi:hypothetical protein